MKKETIILLITLPIALIINLLLMSYSKLIINDFIMLYKEPLTNTEFEKIMIENDFKIENESTQEDENIISIQKAYKENKYEIYFVIYENDENAETIYNYYKENMNNLIRGKYFYKNVGGSNYIKYTATSDYNFVTPIRHKNTIIFVLVDREYKKEINKIIKKLNY